MLLAAAVLSLFAVIRGKSRVEVFRRQLSVDSIRRSNATLVMYLMILFLGVFVLSVLEPHASLLALVFECTSALSTVGSSLGLTPALGEAGKLFVSLLMFIGRVGMSLRSYWDSYLRRSIPNINTRMII